MVGLFPKPKQLGNLGPLGKKRGERVCGVNKQTTMSEGPGCHVQPGEGGALGILSGECGGSWEVRRPRLREVTAAWLEGLLSSPSSSACFQIYWKPGPCGPTQPHLFLKLFSFHSNLPLSRCFWKSPRVTTHRFYGRNFPSSSTCFCFFAFPPGSSTRGILLFFSSFLHAVLPWHDNFTRKNNVPNTSPPFM